MALLNIFYPSFLESTDFFPRAFELKVLSWLLVQLGPSPSGGQCINSNTCEHLPMSAITKAVLYN